MMKSADLIAMRPGLTLDTINLLVQHAGLPVSANLGRGKGKGFRFTDDNAGMLFRALDLMEDGWGPCAAVRLAKEGWVRLPAAGPDDLCAHRRMCLANGMTFEARETLARLAKC